MGARYHVAIGGQGYLVRPGSYRRFRGTARGARRWAREDWRRGIRGGASGYGIEVVRDGRIGLAPAVGTPVPVGEAGGLVAMRAFAGGLYGVSGSSGQVRAFGAGGWTVAYSAPSGTLLSFGEAFGELMVGASDGQVHSYDPYVGVWGLRFTRAAGRPVTAVCGCGWWSSADQQVVPRVAVALSRAAPGTASSTVEILASDEGVSTSFSPDEPVVVAMVEYGRKLMVLTRGQPPVVGGRLLEYDAAGQGWRGNLREVAHFADGTPTCMCVSDGLLWIGMSNGRVLATDRERVVVGLDLAEVGHSGPIRGIVEHGGRLHAAFADGALGAVLACRLPSAESGAPGGSAGAGEGWVLGAYSGVGDDLPTAIVGYDGALRVATARAGGGYSLSVSTTARVPGGEVVTAAIRGEDAGAVKSWRRVIVSHSALLAGESVRLYLSASGPCGPWTDLGASSTVGSTGTAVTVPAGTESRLAWLRVALAGPGASGPEIRGLAVEYDQVGDARRRWSLELRCEGAPGRPLRLLDGTVETKTGAELAAAAEALMGNSAVAFEDLDGASFTVVVERLSETPSELPRGGGPQFLVAIELVEVMSDE